MHSFNIQKEQKLRLRRTTLALFGAMIHTLICIFLFRQNAFALSLKNFILLFSFFWIIHLGFLGLIYFGVNRYFKDPSLTLAQMIWAIFCLMITLLFALQLRGYILMMTLLAMMFGVFKLKFKDFVYIIGFSGICYALVIYYLALHPIAGFNLPIEIAGWMMFVAILFSFALICSEMGAARAHLFDKAELLASGLHNIEELSLTDELTKIRNRRFILMVLDKQRKLVLRKKHLYFFSICLLDIDHFKDINDNYGHLMGDAILKQLSEELSKQLRQIDYVARFGGEEFLIILPFTHAEQAKIVAEHIRSSFENRIFEENKLKISLTVSIGVTQYQPNESIDECIKRADEALYSAKNQGRNKVIVIQ